MKERRLIFAAAVILSACLCSAATAEDYTRQIKHSLPLVQNLSDVSFTVSAEDLSDNTLTFIPADDEAFYYTSRVDFSEKEAPVLIWEGTEVRFNFNGTRLGLRFKNTNSSTSYYNVTVDENTYLLHLEQGYEYDYFLNEEFSEGEHSCIIFKRNEAGMTDQFCGVDVDAEGFKNSTGKIKPSQVLSRKIEFYGDSITAGVCTETVHEDSYDTDLMVCHNAYTAYPAITARKLNWELSDIAVGGTGVTVSWNEFLMSRSWKNLYAKTRSREYDFSGRKPDVVVVNLGQNDWGLPQSRGEKFSPDFQEKYTELLKEIRAQYPDCWIISATGGMSAIKDSRELQSAIRKSVAELQKTDSKLLLYTFNAFTYNHPRVDTHIKMANELVDFINKNIKFDD